jgi:hypothetical protein
MSTTPQNTQDDPTGISNGQADEDRKRHWYQPRPSPPCAADVAGFNWSYWLFIVLLVIVFLLPW